MQSCLLVFDVYLIKTQNINQTDKTTPRPEQGETRQDKKRQENTIKIGFSGIELTIHLYLTRNGIILL